MPFQLVLVRHGQSVYNDENKFTGWADVQLTSEGFEEAVQVIYPHQHNRSTCKT